MDTQQELLLAFCIQKLLDGRESKPYLKKGDKYWIFHGSEENLIKNGGWVLEESTSLFHRKKNPIRYFSVDELNHMNVECNHEECNLYPGTWEGKTVLVKLEKSPLVYRSEEILVKFLHEIVVAAQMNTHNNVHKLLGCCLETESPVLVYEWVEGETLGDRITLKNKNKKKEPLEWKDRLRIAWEVSHAIAYLHTAFPRPIVHTRLTPAAVFLDNNVAKLYLLGSSVSIPEGEEFVEPDIRSGDEHYTAPDFWDHGQVAESIDVYSFGMLLFDLLGAKDVSNSTALKEWILQGIRNGCVSEIVDSAITKNGVTAIEELQLKASIHLALSCTIEEAYCRPTMVEVANELKNMIRSPKSIPSTSSFKERGIYRNFHGSEEAVMQFKALLLQESFSLFHDKAKPIHYLSVLELNNMNVECDKILRYYYRGSWEGRAVLVKLLNTLTSKIQSSTLREIVVATQMATHNNIQKLLGCCIETKFPVLVYEWVADETLEDHILPKDEKQKKLPTLEWKDRLRIAWEISHAVSDLHTTFPWPIIHGSLQLENIFLDPEGSIKLSNFNHYLSIPKGEEFVIKDHRIETISGTRKPECFENHSVAECADVFSFGILFLLLLTGNNAGFAHTRQLDCYLTDLIDCVIKLFRMGRIGEIIDPAINQNEVVTIELKASIDLVLRCTTCLVDCRPTMADIATELGNIIHSHDSIPAAITFQGEDLYRSFRGNKETFLQNEALVVEESMSLFPGKSNLIRYFSVDELNSMKIEYYRVFWDGDFKWYEGSWAGKVVWVKLPYILFDEFCICSNNIRLKLVHEVVVATQMTSHKNLQKLVGCCLETKYPVLVYEGLAAGQNLEDRLLLENENENKLPLLEWKDRLSIARELSHVISYLHTAFARPIVHNCLKLNCVFLEQDNTVKLSKLYLSVSIPEGVKFLDVVSLGYSSRAEPHYHEHSGCMGHMVAECTDVYSFGVIFLVLLTGKPPYFPCSSDVSSAKLIGWVTERIRKEHIGKIVDPAILKQGVATAALTASVKLALRCTGPRDKRPTMADVATQLEKIMIFPDLPNNRLSRSLLRDCFTF